MKDEREAIIKAVEYNPAAIETLNRVTAPKDITKGIQQSADIQASMKEDYNLNIENINYIPNPQNTLANTEQETEKSPFQVGNTGMVENIDLHEIEKTDEDTNEHVCVPIKKINL